MIGLTLPAGPLTIVALGAHPDDIEIGCGGTLLTFSERGDVHVAELVLTGSPNRVVEAGAAAEAFSENVDFRCVGLSDGRLPQAWGEVKQALHEWFDRFPAPDLVLAPRAEDAHQDHAMLGSLVTTVWRDSLVLHYEIPKWDGDIGRPTVYLPMTEEITAAKVRLLHECFPSQRERDWWDDELFLSIMRLRGMEVRSRYAEAFWVQKVVIGLEAS